MNRLVGQMGLEKSPAGRQRLSQWLQSADVEDVQWRVATEHFRLGTVTDGGAVLGYAQDDGASLVCLGYLLGVPTDWDRADRPLDDPNATAAYLLRRYREHGGGLLDGLHGALAVVVVDVPARRTLLGVDRSGQRRLFCHEAGGRLTFANFVSDCGALLGEDLHLDRGLEEFLLGYEFYPDRRTPYADVFVVPVGEVITWEYAQDDEELVRTSRQVLAGNDFSGWRVPTTDDLDTVADALLSGLERALSEQMASSDDVAVMLGGFDSALLASLLKRHGRRVRTFTFQYADASFNQAHTEDLASFLGIEHHWVPITPSVIGRGLRNYAASFNTPACMPHYLIASSEVVRAVRAVGLTHCITGDGCDGLFLGYPTVYTRAVLVDALSKISPLLLPLRPLLRSPKLEAHLGHPYRVARNLLRVLARPMPARGHIAQCLVDEVTLAGLGYDHPPQERDSEQILAELAKGLEEVPMVRLAYKGKGAVGTNKSKLEGASAGHGVTVQSPFLHPGMRALAASIPDRLFRPDERTRSVGTGKFALMHMASRARLLPDDIIYQAKRSPVTAPVDQWYANELRVSLLSAMEALPFELDHNFAKAMVSQKLTEEAYRRHVGISRFAFHAPSLLATYASFCGVAQPSVRPMSSC